VLLLSSTRIVHNAEASAHHQRWGNQTPYFDIAVADVTVVVVMLLFDVLDATATTPAAINVLAAIAGTATPPKAAPVAATPPDPLSPAVTPATSPEAQLTDMEYTVKSIAISNVTSVLIFASYYQRPTTTIRTSCLLVRLLNHAIGSIPNLGQVGHQKRTPLLMCANWG
jgi:hypothetical protein